MKRTSAVMVILALAGPLPARPPVASASQAQTGAQPAAGAPAPPTTSGGNPVGVLGVVNALGQELRRAPAPTGPPPRLPDGTIDLGDGIWFGMTGGGAAGVAQGLKPGEELPLLPAAKAILAARNAADDPVQWCLPLGLVRASPYPLRFIQNYTHKKPTHMYILSEWMGSFRQIFMDGRTHPAELEPTWFGHSIGWYEGDTLVIDTVGFNDKFWLDRRGTPHTEQLHTIERWTRIDAGHLVREITLIDPGAFSRPISYKSELTLAAPGDEVMEYVCQENNQYGIAGGAIKPAAGR